VATENAATTTPPLTIVIATTQRWPEVQPCLDSIHDEAAALGAEVLVLDNTGDGFPPEAAERYPAVTAITEHGASVFRLRSLGLARARGEVVAITEDHCIPRPGWCAGLLRAHAEHPDVAAIGGPVENGARRRFSDWALFLNNHAPFVPPVAGGEVAGLDRANIAYKRRVLPTAPSPEGRGEPFLDERLAAAGERFRLEPDLVSDHVQSLGMGGTLSIAFHNGRAVAGLRLLSGLTPRQRAVKVVRSVGKAPFFLARTSTVVLRRRVVPPRGYASLPVVVPIVLAISGGSVLGYLFGPGDSARHIR
jgi:hypothetical protein